MKIICDKNEILKASNSAIKNTDSKKSAILEGILIEAINNTIKFTTYNEEIGIECTIEGIINEEGKAVVNTKTFSELIKKLPNSDISISTNENNLLEIGSESSTYNLATMSPDEFPDFPQIEIKNSIEIEQQVLKDMIKKTIFSVSADKNRPIFTGELLETKNNKLNIVAIDGFRMALKNQELKNDNKLYVVIPSKTLTKLTGLLSNTDRLVKIGVAKNQAIFEIDNYKVATRTLEGKFLDYENIVPTCFPIKVKANRKTLLNSLERLNILYANGQGQPVIFNIVNTLEQKKIILSCKSAFADAKEEINVEIERGEDLEICFNPIYFIDCLKVIDSEEIELNFTSSTSPCIIKTEDDTDTYMILPIKLR